MWGELHLATSTLPFSKACTSKSYRSVPTGGWLKYWASNSRCYSFRSLTNHVKKLDLSSLVSNLTLTLIWLWHYVMSSTGICDIQIVEFLLWSRFWVSKKGENVNGGEVYNMLHDVMMSLDNCSLSVTNNSSLSQRHHQKVVTDGVRHCKAWFDKQSPSARYSLGLGKGPKNTCMCPNSGGKRNKTMQTYINTRGLTNLWLQRAYFIRLKQD